MAERATVTVEPQIQGDKAAPWYAEVTGYQWLVLVIASAGWMFDAFEGQIFNLTRKDLLAELIATPQGRKFWGDLFISSFLLGGTLGGVLFGTLADRFGRKPAMNASILFYSIFSGLTFFATRIWHVAVLRFLVAMGVGGEWAVAASLVAEVFPARARARAGGIFHATSVGGTWLAASAGLIVGSHWRAAYLIGVVPAMLVLWVRTSVREPERWQRAAAAAGAEPQRLGSFRDLFGEPLWGKRAILGLLLAGVGLSTFWGVVVAGQDLAYNLLHNRLGMDEALAASRAKVAYGYVQATGMFIGFLCMGPLGERIGRRGMFIVMHIGAAIIVPLTCYLPANYGQMLVMLPLYGFFTGGIHAGYAIYFPELFPSRLRATGAGVCFNGGRAVSAVALYGSAWLKARPGMDLRLAVSMLGGLFLLGVVILVFMPETKGQPLPE
jgi:MFS family permease